jgi:NADH-quinone oxidoreductase subunit A
MVFLLSEYIIIIFFLCIGIILSSILFLLAYLFTIKLLDNEKSSIYECGFQPFYTSRLPYDVHFYIIAILFLIFDVEIAFLYP